MLVLTLTWKELRDAREGMLIEESPTGSNRAELEVFRAERSLSGDLGLHRFASEQG